MFTYRASQMRFSSNPLLPYSQLGNKPLPRTQFATLRAIWTTTFGDICSLQPYLVNQASAREVPSKR